jgi:hypothetical protein
MDVKTGYVGRDLLAVPARRPSGQLGDGWLAVAAGGSLTGGSALRERFCAGQAFENSRAPSVSVSASEQTFTPARQRSTPTVPTAVRSGKRPSRSAALG